jgi:hypothetical protein
MAIRNITLGGGSNFGSETLTSDDLNDTFEAAANKLKTMSAFWLNSYFYTVFDDFESYSVGAFTTGTKWTVATSGTGSHTESVTIASSTNAGGSGKELILSTSTGGGSSNDYSRCQLTSNTFSANKHKFLKLFCDVDSGTGTGALTTSIAISFNGGTNYDTVFTGGKPGTSGGAVARGSAYMEVHMVATGSNGFDCYVGGKLIRSVTAASPQIIIRTQSTSDNAVSSASIHFLVYIDDVMESAYSV